MPRDKTARPQGKRKTVRKTPVRSSGASTKEQAAKSGTHPKKMRGQLPGESTPRAAKKVPASPKHAQQRNGKRGTSSNGKTATARGTATPRRPSEPVAPERARRFVSTKVDVEGREEIKIVEVPEFEPEPWGDDAKLTIVGERARRADAYDKVTGGARYTADLHRPGMLHAVMLRSAIPSGRIGRLDLDPALAIPGVRDAITAGDLPPFKVQGFHPFEKTVRYAGQPIAVLCADTLELARRARDAVVIEYEPTPHAVTAADALAPNAPQVRPEGNQPESSPHVATRGNVDRGLAEADVVITREYRTPVALQTALEPHDALAEWDGEQLTVWESTQGIFNTRSDLAAAFGLQFSQVRVLQEFMGGGFGAKNGASTNAYVAATLARRTGRPVRCVNDREGEQLDSGNRTATVQRVTLGAKRDGTLTAIVLDADVPLGIGGWLGGPGKIYHELYRCPNVRTTQRFVYTNAGAMSSFRAPGHVEGAFGLERALDVLARELNIDPLELRLANYAEHDQEKSRPYSSKHLDACYREGAERFGWWARGSGLGARGSGTASAEGTVSPRAVPEPRAPSPEPLILMQIGEQAIRDTAARVFSAREYNSFSPLARFYQWLDELLTRFFAALARVLPSRTESPTLFWLTVTLLIAALLGAAAAMAWRWRRSRIARAMATRHGDERTPVGYVDPWRAAQRLAAEGAFTDAAHALYQALLQGVARTGQIRVHPSKTAGDYARELRTTSSTRFERFRAFARSYDIVVYGLGSCDRDRYERLRLLATEILQSSHG